MISWPAAKGMRCVNPSSASESPDRTKREIASDRERISAMSTALDSRTIAVRSPRSAVRLQNSDCGLRAAGCGPRYLAGTCRRTVASDTPVTTSAPAINQKNDSLPRYSSAQGPAYPTRMAPSRPNATTVPTPPARMAVG